MLLQDLRSGTSPTAPAAAGRDDTLSASPQSSSFVEIRDDATLPLETTIEPEPLKVYPLREEPPPPARPKPQVKPTNLNRPAPRKPPATPAVNPPPRPAPRSQPMLPRSAAPISDPALPPEPTAPTGAWLPLVLFGMTVMAGIVLAFYTLARPFLQ
jgi:hypothetical protein